MSGFLCRESESHIQKETYDLVFIERVAGIRSQRKCIGGNLLSFMRISQFDTQCPLFTQLITYIRGISPQTDTSAQIHFLCMSRQCGHHNDQQYKHFFHDFFFLIIKSVRLIYVSCSFDGAKLWITCYITQLKARKATSLPLIYIDNKLMSYLFFYPFLWRFALLRRYSAFILADPDPCNPVI